MRASEELTIVVALLTMLRGGEHGMIMESTGVKRFPSSVGEFAESLPRCKRSDGLLKNIMSALRAFDLEPVNVGLVPCLAPDMRLLEHVGGIPSSRSVRAAKAFRPWRSRLQVYGPRLCRELMAAIAEARTKGAGSQ